MALHDFEYFLQHSDAFESLSVDQVNALARGELVEYGETAPAESVAAQAAEADPAPAAAAASDAAPAVADPEPKVLAKDGEHTIPFAELEAARAKAAQFEELAKTQSELIEQLKAAKAADAGTGDTVAQEDFLKEFKEQYPDIAAALAPALQKLIDAGVNVKTAELERKLNESIVPLQKSANDIQVDSHFQTITEQVPDFEKLRDSGEVSKWVDTLPGYAKAGAERVLNEGTATEVIELFKAYKEANPPAAATDTTGKSAAELKAAADAAIAKAKAPKVISSTDIPASQTGVIDSEPTTVEGWSRIFAGMKPEDIMKML